MSEIMRDNENEKEKEVKRTYAVNNLHMIFGAVVISWIVDTLISTDKKQIDKDIEDILTDIENIQNRQKRMQLYRSASIKKEYIDNREIYSDLVDVFFNAKTSFDEAKKDGNISDMKKCQNIMVSVLKELYDYKS